MRYCWRGEHLSYWSSKHGTQPQGSYQEELDISPGKPHGRWSSGLFDITFHYHGEYEGRSGDTENKEREGHPATVHCTEEGAQGFPDPDRRTKRMSHGVHSGQIRKLCINAVIYVLVLQWNFVDGFVAILIVHLLIPWK